MESERLRALTSATEQLLEGNSELFGKVLMLLCDQSWAVKRQALLLLQRLGEQLNAESVQLLHRLLYHPDNVVQLLVARILEYVPRETAWKKVLDDRQVAFAAVMQCGLALEFVIDSFREAGRLPKWEYILMSVYCTLLQWLQVALYQFYSLQDKDIVLAAVTQNGEALRFAESWWCDEERFVAF